MSRGHDGSIPHLHDCVLRYLDEGDVLHGPPEQVAEDAPEDGLVRHDDHAVLLPAVLELRQHREDAAAAVQVGLACEAKKRERMRSYSMAKTTCTYIHTVRTYIHKGLKKFVRY